eukprot:GFKZ01015636.1.p2 GENE.GFKZ01015636.1~~GFKZ01015636.1.p2  ORF type:complete len:166 (+),score=7.83 GFKZ01015636.1:545-1042(+)
MVSKSMDSGPWRSEVASSLPLSGLATACIHQRHSWRVERLKNHTARPGTGPLQQARIARAVENSTTKKNKQHQCSIRHGTTVCAAGIKTKGDEGKRARSSRPWAADNEDNALQKCGTGGGIQQSEVVDTRDRGRERRSHEAAENRQAVVGILCGRVVEGESVVFM